MPCSALVIDIGNTRIKWGRLDGKAQLVESHATAIDDQLAWSKTLSHLVLDQECGVSIASVNPPVAERLGRLLGRLGIGPTRWFRSASEVPVRHELDAPERTGADRALAVLAAVGRANRPGPGIVIQCGTAITVERIGPDGIWQGGAIGIGPGLACRALHAGTAQLPKVSELTSGEVPPAWGSSTLPAMEAGILWGAVGTIRELIARQSEGLEPFPWIVWTGGDAPGLARLVCGDWARIEPDLVLMGLSQATAWPE